MNPITKTVELLQAAGITAYNTTPHNPPPLYTIVTDANLGRHYTHRLSTHPKWGNQHIRITVVSRTLEGCRNAITTIRNSLIATYLTSGASPLKEQETSGLMLVGNGADARYNATLIYSTHLPIEEQL